ncbi:nucleotidyltransferase [Veillonella sp. VA139]|uniref:nucleotide-binding domain-containing protein n=1 Tax=Veillonella sp. VA139 TaxID=741830 RepID=UPI000F8CC78B|nr:nucleotidyltransferase [Veillonella sp. VA139]
MSNDFNTFCKNISLDNLEDMKKTAKNLAKKLNKHYYNLDNEGELHMYIVGSVGRNTAISGNSDLDLIFDMPSEIFTQYNNYKSNGQSALLQDVKSVLEESFPKTKISGDGQVVVIQFTKYTVELVPGFMQSNNTFKYPDTHDGGSWEITDPFSEQTTCVSCNQQSSGLYYDFCHIVRSWKNTVGFGIGGLLIDTLVYNFFKENDYFTNYNTEDYLEILISLYKFLKQKNPNQEYWFAVGSNQQVHNSHNGEFVKKADKAYNLLSNIKDSTSKEMNTALRDLLGLKFPKIKSLETKNYSSLSYNENYNNTHSEQFIEQLATVDIRYNLDINCLVIQNGWRPFWLRDFEGYLSHNKQLEFKIQKTSCPAPYDIWWKVRNVGNEAIKRNMVRGNILKSNLKTQNEHTNFEGNHYVECYLIKNGICVARDKINVPIGGI